MLLMVNDMKRMTTVMMMMMTMWFSIPNTHTQSIFNERNWKHVRGEEKGNRKRKSDFELKRSKVNTWLIDDKLRTNTKKKKTFCIVFRSVDLCYLICWLLILWYWCLLLLLLLALHSHSYSHTQIYIHLDLIRFSISVFVSLRWLAFNVACCCCCCIISLYVYLA